MKIDDKEIEELLKGFESEEIKIPNSLDEKIHNKLEEIKPKKTKKRIITVIASILIMIVSYSTIPSFKSFANQVFMYIFGDIGIENAVNNGYNIIPSQEIDIKGNKLLIENIYIDSLRMGFDVKLLNPPKENKNSNEVMYDVGVQVLNIENKDYAMAYGWLNELNEYKSDAYIMGNMITNLYNKNISELELSIELFKDKKLIGKENIKINIPKEMYKTKIIDINKKIKNDRVNLEIDKLELSPTMMYLCTKGIADEKYDLQGLYNYKIISDKMDIYEQNLTISGMGGKEEYKQSMVPSIYYDKSKKYKLKAEGVLASCNEEITIKLNDTYPKEVNYFGTKIIIQSVEYKQKTLTISVLDKNNEVGILSSGQLDGKYSNGDYAGNTYEGGEYGDYDESKEVKVYSNVFENVDKKETYKYKPNFVMKYKIPIDVDIEYKK